MSGDVGGIGVVRTEAMVGHRERPYWWYGATEDYAARRVMTDRNPANVAG